MKVLLKSLVALCFLLSSSLTVECAKVILTGDFASHRGVYEIKFKAYDAQLRPLDSIKFQVEFTRPDLSDVTVDGFIDGGMAKARAYCDMVGKWSYSITTNLSGVDKRSGEFIVKPSELPGKLRIHPEDQRQFAYDNGEWFLHIGDTGYRYVVQSEPLWQEYIDEAAEAGFTKIRTWFAQSRSTVENLFDEQRTNLNFDYWNEIERRLVYALEKYPHIQFQLIPYAEDTQELIRYGQGDKLSQYIAQYAQARWSSFPNVQWEISNDREIADKPDLSTLTGREISRHVINQIGNDMKAREPWSTLITNQQNRFAGYSFVNEPWSDIITLEDIDQVDGRIIKEYREEGDDPVVMDEDRYGRYRNPANPRYFFRRYMWANLLSGGHATYGGLKTYEAYDGGPMRGVQGYFTANRRGVLSQGAHDFRHIHTFFKETGLTLVGMTPNDEIVGSDPLQNKCIHNDETYIIYASNADGNKPESDNPRVKQPEVEIYLPYGAYDIKWYDPTMGYWALQTTATIDGPYKLNPPDLSRVPYSDWVIFIQRRSE